MTAQAGSTSSAAGQNRLASEESPYLLQHKDNPVDWYPWGQEAFDRARAADKPILLSVGYSTCHWCHVMASESFESEEVAALLNASFISIKVDREERPDVDHTYMTYLQATGAGGGWPMNVFLTPDLKPFVAGTYWPPQDAFGRPGFRTVLRKVAQVWQERKDDIRAQADDAIAQLQSLTQSSEQQDSLQEGQMAGAVEKGASVQAARFDPHNGGFGGAPKFPRPAELNMLLAQHLRLKAAEGGGQQQADQLLRMVTFTLERMLRGGMHDHVGGGFHRYSVDKLFHYPHFEKMLYDNAQLVPTYLQAFLASGEARFATAARDVLDYLRRTMTHPEGGIFSAEDADSLDVAGSHKEGAFYLWTQEEVMQALPGAGGELFCKHYNVKREGNATDPMSDPHHEFGGLNCLIERQSVQESASQMGMQVEEAEAQLAQGRKELFHRRAKRPRPHLDNKVITAWNGLAISAFAVASQVLHGQHSKRDFPVEGCNPAEYRDSAVEAAHFVERNLWDSSTKRLKRSFCRGPSAVEGFASDYSYLTGGLLDLYQATGDVHWLDWARQLQTAMDELFWDDVAGLQPALRQCLEALRSSSHCCVIAGSSHTGRAAGGYFSTGSTDPSIMLRMKEEYDGAEPTPSSIAVATLVRLGAMLGREEGARLRKQAARTAAAFSDQLRDQPLAMPQMCAALHLLITPHMRQVIVAGPHDDPRTQELLAAAHASPAPDKVVLPIDLGNAESTAWFQQHNPAALDMAKQAEGKEPSAFICQNFTCQAPTSSPDKVRQLLTAGPNTSQSPKELDVSSLLTKS